MDDRRHVSQTTRPKRRLLPMFGMLAVSAVSSLAGAQGKLATDANTNDLIRQGAAMFEARDYEGARQAFSRAYELQPTPDALLNLALAEINVKRVVEGIGHLRAYIRLPAVPAAQAASVREALLRKAYAKVVRVLVNAPNGTEVQVDDRSEIVKAGDDETIVVMPGTHKLRATDGRTVEFTGVAGGVVALALPTPTAPTALAPAMGKPGSLTSEPPRAPTTASSGTEEGTEAWGTRMLVLTIGAGITLAALGTGVYFFSKEASEQDKVDARRQELRTKYGTPNSCLEGRVGASDPWCAELKDMADTKVRAQNLATASFIAAGVAGVGTLAGFLFWPRKQRPTETGVVFAPVADWSAVGVSVQGRY